MKPFPMLRQVIGCWDSRVGERNVVLTLLRWDSFAERDETRGLLISNDLYKQYLSGLLPLSDRQFTKLVFPAPFSPWK
jgi:hypothetical protein